MLAKFALLLAIIAVAAAQNTPECGRINGVCSNGCTTGEGMWVFGKCTGSKVCCVGGGTQPVVGKKPATFFLASQAFSNNHPGALVYIPKNYDFRGPLNVVVFIHGFGNCIENSVREVKDSAPCTQGGPKCFGFGLLSQMEAADAQAILVLPEVAYDQRSSAAGRLGDNLGFRNFLDELLTHLRPSLGDKTVADINTVQIFSFSGAYYVASRMATVGGVPQVREIILLDSLYGSISVFDSWISKNIKSFGPEPSQYRFANVFGTSTESNSVSQGQRSQTLWNKSGFKTSMILNTKTDTLPQSDYINPMIFKKTSLPHNSIPASYVKPFIQATYGRQSASLRSQFAAGLKKSTEEEDLEENNNVNVDDLVFGDEEMDNDLSLPF